MRAGAMWLRIALLAQACPTRSPSLQTDPSVRLRSRWDLPTQPWPDGQEKRTPPLGRRGTPRGVAMTSWRELLSALRLLRRGLHRALLRRLRSRRLSFGLFQLLRDGIHEAGLIHQHLANNDCALIGVLPFVFVHCLTDGGNRLHAVSGVGAGSVDLVLEPRPLFETLVDGERPLRQQKLGVDFLQRRRLPRRSIILIQPGNGLAITLRGASVSFRTILQRREVQVRWH